MRLAVLVFVVLALVPGASGIAEARAGELAPRSVCPPRAGNTMLCLHNYARRRHGLRPLRASRALAVSAGRKADAIERTRVFEHAPIAGVAWDAYFPGWLHGWAENLAEGYQGVRATFAGWLASPGHRGNILEPWLRWYGSAYRTRGELWVVDLGG